SNTASARSIPVLLHGWPGSMQGSGDESEQGGDGGQAGYGGGEGRGRNHLGQGVELDGQHRGHHGRGHGGFENQYPGGQIRHLQPAGDQQRQDRRQAQPQDGGQGDVA